MERAGDHEPSKGSGSPQCVGSEMDGAHMFSRRAHPGRRGRAVLAACALAILAAAAGCTSGGGQSSSAGSPRPSAASLSSSARSPASWAGSLGSGVMVDPPGSAAPGNDSPQGVMLGVAAAYSTGHYTGLCRYEPPGAQSGCVSAWSGDPGDRVDLSQLPFGRNIKPGYTAIDGDKALIGYTGSVCELKRSPSCVTNNDPAAILDSGKSFSTLWSQSLLSFSESGYSLSQAVKINGKWYAYTVNASIATF
jgi:hypothetical protein